MVTGSNIGKRQTPEPEQTAPTVRALSPGRRRRSGARNRRADALLPRNGDRILRASDSPQYGRALTSETRPCGTHVTLSRQRTFIRQSRDAAQCRLCGKRADTQESSCGSSGLLRSDRRPLRRSPSTISDSWASRSRLSAMSLAPSLGVADSMSSTVRLAKRLSWVELTRRCARALPVVRRTALGLPCLADSICSLSTHGAIHRVHPGQRP
jgi:hypothetical protein